MKKRLVIFVVILSIVTTLAASSFSAKPTMVALDTNTTTTIDPPGW